jgi:hypothetical protein
MNTYELMLLGFECPKMNDTTPMQIALANATLHKGPILRDRATSRNHPKSDPIRNMHLSTDDCLYKIAHPLQKGRR